MAIWDRLLAGPLASEARRRLLELDPPIAVTRAGEARAADLDRQVASRVIADGRDRLPEVDRAALRSLEVEADRVRERFATCNLRMVPSTIRRHGYHRSTGLAMGDLIQEGNIGLLKAIPRFDYRRGFRFSTFATWWIRHYLVRARQNLGADVRACACPSTCKNLGTRCGARRSNSARGSAAIRRGSRSPVSSRCP